MLVTAIHNGVKYQTLTKVVADQYEVQSGPVELPRRSSSSSSQKFSPLVFIW
jgi:hypothetical protein